MNTSEIMSAMIFGDGGASKIEELSTDGGSTDAGKVLVVGDNGKIAASDLTVGEGEVAIDKTLSVNGAAADAKKVGDALSAVNGSLKALYPYEVVFNTDNAISTRWTINSSGKWSAIGTKGCYYRIPDYTRYVDITPRTEGGVIAFLKSIPDFPSGSAVIQADFADGYASRIMLGDGTTERFTIGNDARYIYFLMRTSSSVIVAPDSIKFYSSKQIYDAKLYPYTINGNFVKGDIELSDNSEVFSNKRWRTAGYHEITNMEVVNFNPMLQFKTIYYNKDLQIVGFKDFTSESQVVCQTDFDGAKYVRFVAKRLDDANVITGDLVFYAIYFCTNQSYALSEYDIFTRDVPKNIGVLNIISRAKQVSKITYTPLADLHPNDTTQIIHAGEPYSGIPYSSVRTESLYVPNCVSFHSFMTSVLNENSYLYTRQSTSPNSSIYLGTVCSSFVSYVLDLPCIYTTHYIGELETMRLIDDQSIYGMELGSVLLWKDHHIAICTGIWRDSHGRIKYVEITEAIHPHVVSRIFTPERFATAFPLTRYAIYNYDLAYAVSYTPDQWVAVEGEIQQTPVYNEHIFPRRGDKANWRYGEDVIIDVVPESYTSYKLYLGETLVSTESIPSNNVITLTSLSTGDYKICLTDGSNDSDYAYMSIVDVAVTVEDMGNATAKVSFVCSSNATPAWIGWCYPEGTSDVDAVKFCETISNTDVSNGYIVSTFESGTYKFKVEVANEYGVYSSDFVTATIT